MHSHMKDTYDYTVALDTVFIWAIITTCFNIVCGNMP